MSYLPLSNFKWRWSTVQSILKMPTAFNMTELTQERAFLFAGILVVSLMGSFVMWGPAPKRLKGSKKSRAVNGLANMGETCFLNTLLQALAACPQFCKWLEHHKDSALASALHEIITFVNGYGIETDTPLFPRAVVSALSAHGWSMGLGQQDSHELFFVLMTSLEEQTTEAAKSNDILALLNRDENPEKSSSLNPETSNEDASQNERNESLNTFFGGDALKKTCYISRAGKQMKTSASHKFDFPFRGQQLSQLTCTICSKSSVIQHQAFDCLSLTLPSKGFCTLEQLLANFTAPEQVSDVHCEHCSKGGSPTKTAFVKQLSIGRLPKSLCFHVQRTSWTNDGQAYKRHDFVAFPEVLVMDKFTYFYKERLKRNLLKQLVRPTELNVTPAAVGKTGLTPENKPTTIQTIDGLEAKHRYLLQAVVVHIGEVTSGHFVTFRRVPQPSKCQEQWVCTSDDQCQNSCLAEVLNARAYMLFYEKIGESPVLNFSQG